MAEDYGKLASAGRKRRASRAALAASKSSESASVIESIRALKDEIESVRAESAQCQRSLGDADRRAKNAAARRERCEPISQGRSGECRFGGGAPRGGCLPGVRGRFAQDLEERSRAKASASRECWNALVAFRRERSSAVSTEQIDETDRGNEAWDREWSALETSVIPERRALFERMEAETKEGFTTAIVGALRNGIVDVRRTIRETNAYLSECPFGDIRYRFDCSKNIDYAPYYDRLDPISTMRSAACGTTSSIPRWRGDDSFFDTSGTAVAPRPAAAQAALARKRALLDYKAI
ncbi:MAG: hypothetical protein ACLTQI_01450 [Slackia sp.]